MGGGGRSDRGAGTLVPSCPDLFHPAERRSRLTPMILKPLYSAERLDPAHCLRFTWTGWPTVGLLPRRSGFEDVEPLWEGDGMRLLERSSSAREVQLAFSTRPHVSPVLVAQRAKGRLQHHLRESSVPFAGFSRKVAVRSVGKNTREQVEKYIEEQVGKERFVDSRFEAIMREFTVRCPEVDLSQPSESSHGRYWYNLHLVLVVAERGRIYDSGWLVRIRDGCFAIARKKEHHIAVLSLMPDHLHMALRGNIKHSPQDIALAFQNNLAYLLGQVPIWQPGFYVGTFSEYDMGAIRARAGRG